MKDNMNERDEAWIAELRKTLKHSEEPLPAGGWESIERDLLHVDARRRVFGPVWKKIAAVAAVVAIAVLIIGETVVNQGVVDGDRTFFAGESTTADGQLLNKSIAWPATADDGLVEKVRAALRESIDAPAPEQIAHGTPKRVIDPVSGGGADASLYLAKAVATNSVSAAKNLKESSALTSWPHSTESAERQVSVNNNAKSPAAKAVESKQDGRTTRSGGTVLRNGVSGADGRNAGYALDRTTGRNRRTSMGLFAAGLPTARNATSGTTVPWTFNGGYSLSAMQHVVRVERGYDEYLYNHKQPLSFGLSVRKEIGHGLSLESGLVYSLLRSDVRISVEDESFDQTLHLLGIPLRINWDFLARSNWKLYLGAGGMAEKVVYAEFGSERVSEKTLQWSLMAMTGVQYDFTPHTALYFEPGVSYYLTETDLRTSHTETPVNLSLQIGVRLTY